MQIVDRIEAQMAATNLPLVGITLAAVPCPDTPVILTLHWHGFIKEKLIDADEADTVSYTPIPSSALQLNERWPDLLAVDCAAMEAGWRLGAWDVARAERPGCMRPGADGTEALECLQAFGAFPFGINGNQVVVAAHLVGNQPLDDGDNAFDGLVLLCRLDDHGIGVIENGPQFIAVEPGNVGIHDKVRLPGIQPLAIVEQIVGERDGVRPLVGLDDKVLRHA